MALVKLVLECCIWFKGKHCLKALENKELNGALHGYKVQVLDVSASFMETEK